MNVSPKDMEALAHARQCVQLMEQVLPHEVRDTAPTCIVGALLTVALQHCDSILLLTQTGKNKASAEALMRPAIESALRLAWVTEKDERAKEVTAKTARFPKFSKLFEGFVRNSGKKALSNSVETLHDLTHAGMGQLIQYFSGEKKQNPMEEIAVLRGSAFLVVILAFIACVGFCRFTDRLDEAARIGQLFSDYSLSAGRDALHEITNVMNK